MSLKIEVGFLREENVELTNMCVKALNGSITTTQDRQTAMDAVKKMMDASILKKNTLVEETGGTAPSPNTRRSALISVTSPAGVEVPCALT